MLLSIAKICRFGNCTSNSRNFVEGERLLNAGHVTCHKLSEGSADVNVIGFCLQTAGIKNSPHTIKGGITSNGSILNMQCSCKAGLSVKCKHILSLLLLCNR